MHGNCNFTYLNVVVLSYIQTTWLTLLSGSVFHSEEAAGLGLFLARVPLHHASVVHSLIITARTVLSMEVPSPLLSIV